MMLKVKLPQLHIIYFNNFQTPVLVTNQGGLHFTYESAYCTGHVVKP